MDNADTTFFSTLYGAETKISFFASSRGRNDKDKLVEPPRFVAQIASGDHAAIMQLTAQYAEQDELFFAACPQEGKRHSKDTARASRVLYADVDHALTTDQLSLLTSLDAAIVRSGGVDRQHVYIRLRSEVEPAQLEAINETLSHELDSEKWSVDSLLRVPGTWNRKPGRGQCEVQQMPQLSTPPSIKGILLHSPERVLARDLDFTPSELPPVIRGLIAEERDDRSEHVHIIAKELLKHGYSEEDAAYQLSQCEPYLQKFGNRSDQKAQLKREIENAQRALKAEGFTPKPEPKRGPWQPTSLLAIFQNPPPVPELIGLTQSLYQGKIHWFQGEPESAKSMVALAEIVWRLKAKMRCVLFDEEAGELDVVDKLRALGAEIDNLEYLAYFSPEGRDALGGVEGLLEFVTEFQPTLVVFDSASAFLSIAGINENEAPGVNNFFTTVLQPLALRHKISVIVIDHLTKASAGQTRYARGSGSKLALVDVAWEFVMNQPFKRNVSGQVTMTCRKDRLGVIGRDSQVNILVKAMNDKLRLIATSIAAADVASHKEEIKEAGEGIKLNYMLDAMRALGAETQPVSVLDIAAKQYPDLDPKKKRPEVSKNLAELKAQGRVIDQKISGNKNGWLIVDEV